LCRYDSEDFAHEVDLSVEFVGFVEEGLIFEVDFLFDLVGDRVFEGLEEERGLLVGEFLLL